MIDKRLVKFELTRSIVIPGTCIEIESSHTIETPTSDAMVTAMLIRESLPGWTLVNIESGIDREYKEVFGDDTKSCYRCGYAVDDIGFCIGCHARQL